MNEVRQWSNGFPSAVHRALWRRRTTRKPNESTSGFPMASSGGMRPVPEVFGRSLRRPGNLVGSTSTEFWTISQTDDMQANKALQLTCQPVTRLAKRRARRAPGCHAAELGRYAASNRLGGGQRGYRKSRTWRSHGVPTEAIRLVQPRGHVACMPLPDGLPRTQSDGPPRDLRRAASRGGQPNLSRAHDVLGAAGVRERGAEWQDPRPRGPVGPSTECVRPCGPPEIGRAHV